MQLEKNTKGEIKCYKCYLTLRVKECELTNSLFYTGCINRLICSSKRSIRIGRLLSLQMLFRKLITEGAAQYKKRGILVSLKNSKYPGGVELPLLAKQNPKSWSSPAPGRPRKLICHSHFQLSTSVPACRRVTFQLISVCWA